MCIETASSALVYLVFKTSFLTIACVSNENQSQFMQIAEYEYADQRTWRTP